MRKIFLSFFALMVIFSGTLGAFKSWQASENGLVLNNVVPFNETIKIKNISVPDGKYLVPKGAILTENSVDCVYYEYLVNTTNNEEILVNLSNIKLTNSEGTYNGADLLHYEYFVESMGNNYSKVSIQVFLEMPNSETEYHMLANSSIGFDLLLKIEQ